MNSSEKAQPVAQKRLGEVALYVHDLDAMTAFYRDIVQLALLRKEPHMAFFEIAPGYKGHTSVLALFKRRKGDVAHKGALDHLAFSIHLADYENERERLQGLGYAVRTAVHNWMQWRSLYIDDPEGNEVELVCYDPSIPKNFES